MKLENQTDLNFDWSTLLGEEGINMATGDHIEVKRKKLGLEYYHHGIEVGDEEVIHLTGDNKKNAKVIKTSLSEFLQKRKKEIVDYVRFIDVLVDHKKELRSLYGDDWILPILDDITIADIKQRIGKPEKAVAEAKKYVGKSGYGLFTDNCEHFAVFCKTGLKISLQIIEYHKFIKLATTASRSQHRLPFHAL